MAQTRLGSTQRNNDTAPAREIHRDQGEEMTDEQIAKLYDQALIIENNGDYVVGELDPVKFAKLVAQHEREACAKVADEHDFYGVSIARDIRARGEA